MIPTDAPVVRRATLADASLLAELGARTFSETFAEHNKPEDMATYLTAAFSTETQAAELADSTSVVFIAEIGQSPVGYAKLHWGAAPACVTESNPVELARLYVINAWLGHGVGEALMRTCIDEARRAGNGTMWLGVWEKNWRAQAFYRKWQFSVVGDHIFVLGSDPQTDLLMKRDLSDAVRLSL